MVGRRAFQPLLGELLHVLGSRAPGPRLVHAAPCQHGHDGQHLGAGAQLQDGEEVLGPMAGLGASKQYHITGNSTNPLCFATTSRIN